MNTVTPAPALLGPYRGEIAPAFHTPAFLARLESIGAWVATPDAHILSCGRNRQVRLETQAEDRLIVLAVKRFGKQSALKDWSDAVRGTKARRSWLAACALRARGLGTPEPIGYLERWRGRRLEDSYFLAQYEPDLISFKSELIRLFADEPDCGKFMALLQAVADAVRAMHEAGFLHRDLGNQNILLRHADKPSADGILFVDLNRARWKDAPLAVGDRARDLSRIWLPSDLLRVFLDMYMGAAPSPLLRKRERFHRKAYALLADTRHLRHPFRTRRNRKRAAAPTYPAPTDLWIWDEKSAQAIGAWQRKDRQRHFPRGRHASIALAALADAPGVWREYRRLLAACWQTPVAMKDRVGIAVQPRPATWDRERALLAGLGRIPVLIRFYAHEQPRDWSFAAEAAQALRKDGHAVSVALVQNRRAIVEPLSWLRFVRHVLDAVGPVADRIEIGHAINRVKWGLWDVAEYRRLLDGVAAVACAGSNLKFMGPAAIDFDFPHVLAALRAMPPTLRFDALSHHLYVDRRGAPENRQGPFSALEKFALARAIACRANRCADRLIVSEANWPLQGTGVWSPVGSPYESPGPRRNDPSVSEDEYADFMLRYLCLALCSGMVERVYWWRLVARGFGLVDDTDPDAWRERPAYRMLETFLALLGDAEFVREESRPVEAEPAPATAAARRPTPPIVRRLTFRKADGQTLAMLHTTGAAADWPLPDRAERVLDAFGADQTPATPTLLRLTGRPVYVLGKENG